MGFAKIVIGSGAEAKGLNAAVWASKTVKDEMTRYQPGLIYDGNRLAW